MKGALAALLLAASSAAATTQVHYVMGSYLRVTVDGDVPPARLAPCFADARVLDRAFSRFDALSELVAVNAAGGGWPSPAFRVVLTDALALSRSTSGAFDPSLGALTALWRAPARPSAEDVARARDTVGRVRLDGERITLGAGTALDLDGFAKGAAVDRCVASLRSAGIARALVSFGESSLYAIGAPRGSRGWLLEVRGGDPGLAVARLWLRDQAASVSAVYGAQGRRGPNDVGHIVDPRTGAPLVDDAVAVVVAPRAAEAEALSKAVLVWGEHGVARAERRVGVRAARIVPNRITAGAAMRRAGALAILSQPRPLAEEGVPR